MNGSRSPEHRGTGQDGMAWTVRDLPRLVLKLVVLVIGLVALTSALDYLIPSFPGARHVRSWLRMTVFLVLFARWVGESEVPWLRLTGFMAGFMALFEGAWFVLEVVLEPVTGRSPW
jgi:hypothetical protein